MLTSDVPDLAIGDLNTPTAAAAAVCQSECEENLSDSSSESEEDEDYSSDRSLSEYHPEDDLVPAPDSEDSEEEEGGDTSKTDLELLTPPCKKRREEEEEDTHPAEKYLGGCEAKRPVTFPPEFDLSSQYVPWLSKSSHCEYSIPDKKSWIESWSSENDKERKGFNYLDVYGFYKRKTRMGGWGVMLRDPCGKPVIASASVQPQGKSFFFHVLDGVKAGLALALQHDRHDLRLMCNSATLDPCLRDMFDLVDNGLRKTRFARYECGTCDKCLRFVIPLSDNEFVILVDTLRDIIKLRSKIMEKSRYFRATNGTVFNTAAYHLAKQLARDREMESEPKTVIIKPIDFEKELKKILYDDAYAGATMYSQQLQRYR